MLSILSSKSSFTKDFDALWNANPIYYAKILNSESRSGIQDLDVFYEAKRDTSTASFSLGPVVVINKDEPGSQFM